MRIAAGISGAVLCLKAGIPRNLLSEIERGYRDLDEDELGQIKAALEELQIAKQQIQTFAAKVGWPIEALT